MTRFQKYIVSLSFPCFASATIHPDRNIGQNDERTKQLRCKKNHYINTVIDGEHLLWLMKNMRTQNIFKLLASRRRSREKEIHTRKMRTLNCWLANELKEKLIELGSIQLAFVSPKDLFFFNWIIEPDNYPIMQIDMNLEITALLHIDCKR